MNMFLHEVKAARRAMLIWSCALCAWIILLSSFYPTLSSNAAGITKILAGYPEAVRNVLGLSADSFKDFLGYYSFAFQGVIELGAVQAMMLGAFIIFKKVRDKTADFLFTKPIKRKQIMTSKLLAAGVTLAMTNVIYLIVASIMVYLVAAESVNMRVFLMISITLFFVQLIFMSFGTLVAVLFPRMKSATAVSIGALFFYLIAYDVLKPMVGGYAVRFAVPFEYFGNEYIIKNASYEAPFVLTTILLIAVSLAASYFLYSVKDIPTA